MKKKEFPIWFKIETMLFAFFSGAIGINYFKMRGELDILDARYLLTKLIILMSIVFLIWLISFILCCHNK